ncbi:hypothetical protein B0A49_13293 [Cryomyces minteri]|uniref:Uncharacterized protein n=1 Tax=Cryomyces minteri TaxID=331657 RepID=A0A4U0WFS1_9PEZI|nr:hypothetical protein B0A49_13293 [Cryomyces minteri]
MQPRPYYDTKMIQSARTRDSLADCWTRWTADGTRIPPALIYKGESGDLQDSWLEDFDDAQDLAFFASSEKGRSSEVLGLQWLEHVFDHNTRQKAARSRRLLIVDGHNSHLNLRFIDYADRNRILLAILPPHSTHRLQPLDVGLFAPLATYYTQGIDALLASSQGLVRTTKRQFWKLFCEAWERSFTEKNIQSAWEATGIYPFNPERVIATITRENTTPEPQQVRTPRSARSVRRMFNQLQKDGRVTAEALPLLYVGEKLATENEVLRHEIQGLRKAITEEKKKHKRGKVMGLLEKGENAGQPLFFSPSRVGRARQRVADEAQAEQQHKQAIQERRLQSAVTRAEKAREVEERKAARVAARNAAKEEQARKRAEQAAEKATQQASKLAEATKQRQEAAIRKKQSMVAKEAKENAVQSKKRRLVEEGVVAPRKRPCAKLPTRRDKQEHIDEVSQTSSSPIEALNYRNCWGEQDEHWDDMTELRSDTQSSLATRRTRSSSPRKPTTDGAYRARNLFRASILVDVETPADIVKTVDIILGVKQTSEDGVLLQVAADEWHRSSKQLVTGENIGEAEWTDAIVALIKNLQPEGVRHARNRDWKSELKPHVHQPPPPTSRVPQKRSQSLRVEIQNDLVTSDSTIERQTGNVTTQHYPSPANTAQLKQPQRGTLSVGTPSLPQPTEPTPASPPMFSLKDPRPDIFVGLDHESMNHVIQSAKKVLGSQYLLSDWQDNGTLISDPGVTPLSLRFPFLIVEAKSGATGGNLYQAQNQAAVSGACALKILRDLAHLHDPEPDSGPESTEKQQQHQHQLPQIVFSVTNEGSIHELWAHFWNADNSTFNMTCLGVWRTTSAVNALKLTGHIAAILRWGAGDLRRDIVESIVAL